MITQEDDDIKKSSHQSRRGSRIFFVVSKLKLYWLVKAITIFKRLLKNGRVTLAESRRLHQYHGKTPLRIELYKSNRDVLLASKGKNVLTYYKTTSKLNVVETNKKTNLDKFLKKVEIEIPKDIKESTAKTSVLETTQKRIPTAALGNSVKSLGVTAYQSLVDDSLSRPSGSTTITSSYIIYISSKDMTI